MINHLSPSPHKILEIIKETKSEHTFRVQCDADIQHGQYFMISVPKVGEAPISVSARGKGWVEFTIRKVGRLTNGLFGLSCGDTLFMRGPYGNAFPVDDFKDKHLVVITGGTGIASVRSMLQHFHLCREEIKTVWMIAGFKDLDSVLFADDLAQFRTEFNTIYTLDNTEASGFEKGFVTSHIKRIPFAEFGEYNVVIVGPPNMIRFSALECIAEGADEARIWVSLERKMSCAIGKCGHCKINENYVCLEGPVFNYSKAKSMFD